MKDGTISETDLAAVETGEQEAEQQDTTEQAAAEKTATETASDEAPAGEPSEEEKQAAKEAEEAEERERLKRESTPGTPEFYQSQAKRAKEGKKKLGIELGKEREERIRAEEREKTLRDLIDKGVIGKGGDKPAQTADEDPKPIHPRMKDFESQEQYEEAVSKFQDDRFSWERRELGRQQKAEQEKSTRERSSAEERNQQIAPFIKRRDEIGTEIVKNFGKETLTEVQENLKLPAGSAMVGAIFESPNAAAIMHYLVENEGAEDRILGLGLRGQVAEIEKIERIVSAKPAPRIPKAPEPVKTVKGGASHPTEVSDDIEALERVLKKK